MELTPKKDGLRRAATGGRFWTAIGSHARRHAVFATLGLLLAAGCGRQPPPTGTAVAEELPERDSDAQVPLPAWAPYQAELSEKARKLTGRLAAMARPAARRAKKPATPSATTTAIEAAARAYATAATPAERQAILERVAGIDDERLLPLVRESFDYPEPAVRLAALDVLADIGGRAAGRLIAAALRDPAPEVRREALYQLDAPAVTPAEKPALVSTAIGDREAVVRFAALDAAESLPPADRLQVLATALASEYRDVRTEALILLQGENSAAAQNVAVSALTTTDPDFHREVEETLELMRGCMTAAGEKAAP